MKIFLSTQTVLAYILLSRFHVLIQSHSFTAQSTAFVSVHLRATQATHPAHKNSYLEQISATSTNDEVHSQSSMIEKKAEVEQESMEELSETQKLLQKVKQAGTAGAISYALWELGFWGVSIPVCIAGYRELTGHWPDLRNSEDLQKLGAEAFAFVNFARLAVPLRIGLALSTTGWIDDNVVKKIMKRKDNGIENDGN